MLMRGDSSTEAMILSAVYGNRSDMIEDVMCRPPAETLYILARHLSQDLPIEVLERFERILKAVLRKRLRSRLTGKEARELAIFQKELGFLLKYKSYCVKACTPLGYSIFLQNPLEGFSFQQHVKHKTEVFHILDVQSEGYVFICGLEEWGQVYDQDSFSRWLEGHPDNRYDQYRFFPRSGDVFVIDRLGVVHSAIGCVLEEFATVSTDMVDRLHDQNAGKPIPPWYDRSYAQDRLTRIPVPSGNCQIEILSGHARATELTPIRIAGGRMIVLARSSMRASRYFIERSQSTDLLTDKMCGASLHVAQGKGRVIIGSLDEVGQFTPPSCEVCAGDLLMIPPGIYYGFVNEGSDDLVISEHRIEVEVALVGERT